MLAVNNLSVAVEDKTILSGVNLKLKPGELVAVMGPNGSGKSTLGYTLAGHPGYQVFGGKISLDGKMITRLGPDERARRGLFLGFQYPVSVAGVDLMNLLRQAYSSVNGTKLAPFEFRELVKSQIASLKLGEGFIDRSVNDGFSGGEKKKSEVLQLAILRPKYAILDEIDSGLDIDAIKVVARAIKRIKKDNPKMAMILITHYQRILSYLPVDRVVIIKAGKVVKEGSGRLVAKLERHGYGGL